MKYVLIPVKDLSKAKQRLAGVMSPDERTTLARLMMEHVFQQVSNAGGYDRAAVVTLYEPAIQLGDRLGFEIIRETEQISETVSVDSASRILTETGAHSVLRLPVDLPLVRAEDIDAVLSRLSGRAGKPEAVIVASRDRTGTNALGRTPPRLFPSHFGPGSFERHRREAQRCGAAWLELDLAPIRCDIDDPEDVAYLLEQGCSGKAREYLMELRMRDRLQSRAREQGCRS